MVVCASEEKKSTVQETGARRRGKGGAVLYRMGSKDLSQLLTLDTDVEKGTKTALDHGREWV